MMFFFVSSSHITRAKHINNIVHYWALSTYLGRYLISFLIFIYTLQITFVYCLWFTSQKLHFPWCLNLWFFLSTLELFFVITFIKFFGISTLMSQHLLNCLISLVKKLFNWCLAARIHLLDLGLGNIFFCINYGLTFVIFRLNFWPIEFHMCITFTGLSWYRSLRLIM